MKLIEKVADELGLSSSDLIPYGSYKAKISLSGIKKDRKGKMIVVTGITPTPAGEGKTTTVVGLAQGMGKLGKKVVATLREPSLGPIFGIKGGGTGGGAAKVEPEDEVNIHFTGDAHAVGSAHNLLVALTDNVAQRGKIDGFSPQGITIRRVTDVEERSLRSVLTGIGGKANAPLRETGFDIVTASEVMAILALSSNLEDLRDRLSKIVVGYKDDGTPVQAKEINAVGSMMSLLRYAIQPNIVQTTEGQPVFVHTGPFGNIAHGCCSVVSDQLALGYADYVLTEAGFGADLGFEKFMHIKARLNNLEPDAAVIVASVRALKSHGGVSLRNLEEPNKEALADGMSNLSHLIKVIKSFNLPVVVAVNSFPSDLAEETELVKSMSLAAGAEHAVISKVFEDGGEGGIDLAEAVVKAAENSPESISYMYELSDSLEDKISALATKVYNAQDVNYTPLARRALRQFEQNGWGSLPICMAKTHLSLSHNRSLKGLPSNYQFRVSDARASVGAGFIYPIAGSIMTMPGLPGEPRALDVDDSGNIIGL
ncbi:MAG TPA: formate--tetrahydrofolate ligase [Dehalococcoidia bacterium]|nr:formate--tetrahydrofolate ligase [Chloroflexota bacterium]HCE75714.1 formate--tetrahydrofolate ligase [Dehalococcoidia bacterium]|tara:strand:- start:20208 stop:21827 length:1620 start_codon:yes stop_codon:yes gene_type:complete